MSTSTRFLSFVAAPAAPTSTPLSTVRYFTPHLRFTNSGQVTFLPAHHPKSLRPATYQNNDAAYDGVPCVDTVLGMPYGADPAEDAEYLRTNLENYEAQEDNTGDAEYEVAEGKDAVYLMSMYSFSANNLDYDAECNNDTAAHWLRSRGYY
jgi:hypothetical protein